MALHGNVAINAQTILYWSAKRIADGLPGCPNTYECEVWEPMTRQGWTFELKHDYEDGAAVLASKVLKAFSKEAKKDFKRQVRA